MRNQTVTFVEKFLSEKENPKSVLDVGSAHINGSLGKFFREKGIKYTGLDMRDGENVDVVLNAHDMKKKFRNQQFDMVCCFDTLEHDDKFWVTVANCRWVLKKGGYLLIGVPGRNCPLHEHPGDYWRFMENGVRSFYEGMVDVFVDAQRDDPGHMGVDEVYAWGKK